MSDCAECYGSGRKYGAGIGADGELASTRCHYCGGSGKAGRYRREVDEAEADPVLRHTIGACCTDATEGMVRCTREGA